MNGAAAANSYVSTAEDEVTLLTVSPEEEETMELSPDKEVA